MDNKNWFEYNEEIPANLYLKFKTKRVAIFIGAGISRLLGSDSWWELAKRLLDKCFEENKIKDNYRKSLLKNGEDLRKAFSISKKYLSSEDYYKIIKEGIKDKESVLLKNYAKSSVEYMKEVKNNDDLLDAINNDFKDLKYDKIYELLSDFASNALFITTNQDQIFENYLNRSFILNNDLKLPYTLLTQHNNLIKIHGCISNPETMLFTTLEYLQRYKNRDYVEFLKKIYQDYNILFLGYGLAEDDILRYLAPKAYNNTTENNYVLVESNKTELEKELASDLGIIPIIYDIKNKYSYGSIYDLLEEWKKIIYDDNHIEELIKNFKNNFSRNIEKIKKYKNLHKFVIPFLEYEEFEALSKNDFFNPKLLGTPQKKIFEDFWGNNLVDGIYYKPFYGILFIKNNLDKKVFIGKNRSEIFEILQNIYEYEYNNRELNIPNLENKIYILSKIYDSSFNFNILEWFEFYLECKNINFYRIINDYFNLMETVDKNNKKTAKDMLFLFLDKSKDSFNSNFLLNYCKKRKILDKFVDSLIDIKKYWKLIKDYIYKHNILYYSFNEVIENKPKYKLSINEWNIENLHYFYTKLSSIDKNIKKKIIIYFIEEINKLNIRDNSYNEILYDFILYFIKENWDEFGSELFLIFLEKLLKISSDKNYLDNNLLKSFEEISIRFSKDIKNNNKIKYYILEILKKVYNLKNIKDNSYNISFVLKFLRLFYIDSGDYYNQIIKISKNIDLKEVAHLYYDSSINITEWKTVKPEEKDIEQLEGKTIKEKIQIFKNREIKSDLDRYDYYNYNIGNQLLTQEVENNFDDYISYIEEFNKNEYYDLLVSFLNGVYKYFQNNKNNHNDENTIEIINSLIRNNDFDKYNTSISTYILYILKKLDIKKMYNGNIINIFKFLIEKIPCEKMELPQGGVYIPTTRHQLIELLVDFTYKNKENFRRVESLFDILTNNNDDKISLIFYSGYLNQKWLIKNINKILNIDNKDELIEAIISNGNISLELFLYYHEVLEGYLINNRRGELLFVETENKINKKIIKYLIRIYLRGNWDVDIENKLLGVLDFNNINDIIYTLESLSNLDGYILEDKNSGWIQKIIDLVVNIYENNNDFNRDKESMIIKLLLLETMLSLNKYTKNQNFKYEFFLNTVKGFTIFELLKIDKENKNERGYLIYKLMTYTRKRIMINIEEILNYINDYEFYYNIVINILATAPDIADNNLFKNILIIIKNNLPDKFKIISNYYLLAEKDINI